MNARFMNYRTVLMAAAVVVVVVSVGCPAKKNTTEAVTGTDLPLPTTTASVVDYAIAATGSRVYVVWADVNADMWFSASEDNGATWTVIDTGTPFFTSTAPENLQIAADGLNVHIAWEHTANGNKDIAYLRSANGGTTWDSVARLDSGDAAGSATSQRMKLACSGNVVVAAWQDGRTGNQQIFVNWSVNNGVTWLAAAENAVRTAAGNSRVSTHPSLGLSGGTFTVAWLADAERIYMNQRSATGGTWADEIRVDRQTGGTTQPPVTTMNGSSAHFAWPHDIGAFAIKYNATADAGASFSFPVDDARVDTDTGGVGNSDLPAIVADGTYVFVAWHDLRNGDQIFFNRSSDNGMNWGATDTQISDDKGFDPVIGRCPKAVVVAWEDRSGPSANVFFDYSTDHGATWQTNDLQLNSGDAASAEARQPRLATSGNTVYILWRDNRSGIFRVYLHRITVN